MNSAAERGREFEEEVAEILRASGFHVSKNAKAARPRQTDLYAEGDELSLLVEVKNRKRKVDVSDVDALRARLNRITPDVIGVMFTASSLSQNAIRAIELDRTREVLAFVKEEVDLLRSGSQNLRTLIERKRRALRVEGKAWFGPTSRLEFVGVSLPLGNAEFRIGNSASPFFASRTRWANASYALSIPDPGWGISGGEGAMLRVQLALSRPEDLRNILGYLHQKFGLSNNGMFSIHQSDMSWHGVGAENFLQAVTRWRERYAHPQIKKLHHSESVTYFDHLRSGWLLLSSQQRVRLERAGTSRDSFLHESELAIQLPGIPLDTAPFLNLCRYTRNEWAEFEYVPQRQTHRQRLRKKIPLEILGTVVHTLDMETAKRRERVVIGVVARNPFFGKKSLPNELRSNDLSMLRELHETELILCAIRDWHDDGDLIDRYMLEGFETTQAYVGQFIRPFGTWNNIVKRVRTWDGPSELTRMLDDIADAEAQN